MVSASKKCMISSKRQVLWIYKLYKNDRHEILNETDRDKVYADLLAWMRVRIDT